MTTRELDEPIRRYDLLIFDWDGTLYDSAGTIVNAIRATCADLNLTVPTVAQARWVIGLSFQTALMRIVPDLRTEDFPNFLDIYRRHYFANDTVTLFDEVLPLLQRLSDAKLKLAVATGKSRVGLDRALLQTHLNLLFDTSRCADETASKPDPLMLQEILREQATEPQRALMIGDTSHDVRMAQAVPMDVIAVHYGAHSGEELRGCAPTAHAASVAELAELLFKFCGLSSN